MTREEMRERVRAYLSGGGLFNPELANHDAVRDLIMDLDAAIALIRAETLEEAAKVCEPQPTEAWSYHWREAGQHIATAIRALEERT